MKHYNVEVYARISHGRYGTEYKGIVTIGIEAKNKKEAKEIAKAYVKDYEWFDKELHMTCRAEWYHLTIDVTEA